MCAIAETDTIEQVICGDENYDGARPCNFDWVLSLSEQCKAYDVPFCFIETGTNFIKNGKPYHLPNKRLQSEMAFRANVNNDGREIKFNLKDPMGFEIDEEFLDKPYFRESCMTCGSRMICNGCSRWRNRSMLGQHERMKTVKICQFCQK